MDGYRVGEQGAPGTIYEGFTLSYAEGFDSAYDDTFIVPHRMDQGRWVSSIDYKGGPRESFGQLDAARDTSPFDFGYKDAARGVPGKFTNNRVENGALVMDARGTTTAQKALLGPGRYILTGSAYTGFACLFNPGPEGTGDVILERRFRQSAGASGYHTDLWCSGYEYPNGSQTKIDINFENADHKFVPAPNALNPMFGAFFEPANQSYGSLIPYSVLSWKLNTSTDYGVTAYKNGAPFVVGHGDANKFRINMREMITAHVVSSETNQTAWDNLAASNTSGGTLEIDYVRIWRRMGLDHFKPLVTVPVTRVASGAATTIQLPAAADLWGKQPDGEYVQAIQLEHDEPGADEAGYGPLPLGCSYNATTRVITIGTAVTAKSGRLNFNVSARNAAGSTCTPLRVILDVGPRIDLASISYSPGTAGQIDLYPLVDCGILVTDGITCTKQIAVTNLPSGFSYDPATFILSWTSTASGTGDITVSATNSVGQTASRTVPISTASQPVLNEDAVTTAYVNKMTVSPPQALRQRIDDLIAGLRADGDLASFKRLSLLAVHDKQAGLLDAIAPATKTLSEVGGGTFEANKGWKGDGTAAYLRMNETVYQAGASQNDIAFGLWCNQQNGATGVSSQLSEANASPGHSFSPRGNAGNDTFRCSDVTSDVFMTQGGSPTRTGHRTASRTGAAIKRGFYNGARTADLTTPSTTAVYEMYLGKASTAYNADRFAIFYVCSGLSDAGVARIHARFNTFLTAIGAA